MHWAVRVGSGPASRCYEFEANGVQIGRKTALGTDYAITTQELQGKTERKHREIVSWAREFGKNNAYCIVGDNSLGGKNCQDFAVELCEFLGIDTSQLPWRQARILKTAGAGLLTDIALGTGLVEAGAAVGAAAVGAVAAPEVLAAGAVAGAAVFAYNAWAGDDAGPTDSSSPNSDFFPLLSPESPEPRGSGRRSSSCPSKLSQSSSKGSYLFRGFRGFRFSQSSGKPPSHGRKVALPVQLQRATRRRRNLDTE